ncbi:MFS transporter [Virgibacillus profundi]|uniref:MFS transporter n=1 Tax=Virgibacillus profundi TaxID=2024555 RepID=A0A2A2IA72_9BACI|nr:MFS transporter [Virgibacillus profundi]PXY52213.1 MFS transporter [Virgibacillus profundi]
MVAKFIGKFYYGWFIVFIAGLGVFFSGPGQTYSNSTFIDAYISDFGWSRSQVSGIYSAATLVAGLIMIFIGRFIDRFGQRIMMVVIGVLFAIACFWNSIVSSIWMLALGFFFIRLLGQGSMTLIPNTLVAQWFIKKRGFAFSIMTLGSFISAMLFPVINTWLINTWDWRFAWQFWGVLLLLVFVPIALFGVRNKPEDMGLKPDGPGKQKDMKYKPLIGVNVVKEAAEDWTLTEAKKTRAFWAILVCVGIPAMVNTGITFHVISIFGTNDLSPAIAAMVLSLMAMVGIPMSFISGMITDRIPTNYLLVAIFIIEIILLLMLIVTKSLWMAILFGIVWGIANGLERISLNVIWPNYFGRKHIGSINGVGVTMTVIGSSLGPLPFGVGFDLFHSYTPVLLVTLIFPVIGVICSIIAKKPSKAQIGIKSF